MLLRVCVVCDLWCVCCVVSFVSSSHNCHYHHHTTTPPPLKALSPTPLSLQFHKYDSKADLWSVGSILYELLVGRPPFTGANHVQLLRAIERSDARIPPALDATLTRTCAEAWCLVDSAHSNPQCATLTILVSIPTTHTHVRVVRRSFNPCTQRRAEH